MKLIVRQNGRFLKKQIEKNSFVGKFSYMGAEGSAHQNNLEIGKLRSKLRSAGQNNIFNLIPPKFDNFEKILTKILRKNFLLLVQKRGYRRLYKRKKEKLYFFFEGPSYALYTS